jgi:hypothetical protein
MRDIGAALEPGVPLDPAQMRERRGKGGRE